MIHPAETGSEKPEIPQGHLWVRIPAGDAESPSNPFHLLFPLLSAFPGWRHCRCWAGVQLPSFGAGRTEDESLFQLLPPLAAAPHPGLVLSVPAPG